MDGPGPRPRSIANAPPSFVKRIALGRPLGQSAVGHPQIEGAFPPDRIIGLVEPLLGGLSPGPIKFADQGPGGVEFRGGQKGFEIASAVDPVHEETHVFIT